MIYHIPFPFPVTFPINIFGSEEVVSILDLILVLTLVISSIYGFFKGFLSPIFVVGLINSSTFNHEKESLVIFLQSIDSFFHHHIKGRLITISVFAIIGVSVQSVVHVRHGKES